jgi:CRP-like cAMP-binding protein
LRERLRAVLLFSDLDDVQLERLAAHTSAFAAPAGRALIQRDHPGSGLFVLEEGTAVVEAPEGTRQLGPGDVFGERSLFHEEGERTARVRAQTDVRCLAIARPEVERLMAEHPKIGERLRHLSA